MKTTLCFLGGGGLACLIVCLDGCLVGYLVILRQGLSTVLTVLKLTM